LHIVENPHFWITQAIEPIIATKKFFLNPLDPLNLLTKITAAYLQTFLKT
jgi:hypothetical protein